MWVVVLFIILLLILLLLFLISSFHIIIGAFTISLPAWGLGLIIGFGVFFSLRQYHLSSLRSPEALAKLVKLNFDGNKLNCSIQDTEVKKYGETGLPYGLAVFSCLAVTIFYLMYLFSTDSFAGYTFAMTDIAGNRDRATSVSGNTVFVLACIISVIPIAFAFTKLKANQSFGSSVRKEVERLVSQANFSIAPTSELQSLTNQIKSLSSKADVQFPDSSVAAVRAYVESHKSDLLINTTGLDNLLNSELKKAKQDRDNLEKSVGFYDRAMSFYSETSRQVNRTGSIPLIKELEYNYDGLTSENLKSLLTSRKWNDFQEVVGAIGEDLQRLYNLASKYEEQETEAEEFYDENDEEKAYRALGVSSTATNEQIKKIYRRLVDIYHPDKQVVSDDEKIKEINWAFEYLKGLRKI